LGVRSGPEFRVVIAAAVGAWYRLVGQPYAAGHDSRKSCTGLSEALFVAAFLAAVVDHGLI
jgi:hypothetical protein